MDPLRKKYMPSITMSIDIDEEVRTRRTHPESLNDDVELIVSKSREGPLEEYVQQAEYKPDPDDLRLAHADLFKSNPKAAKTLNMFTNH